MKFYNKEPLSWIDGIPVFVESTEYSNNYNNIACDHLRHLAAHGRSPFMTNEQIDESIFATFRLIEEFAIPESSILDCGVGTGLMWKGASQYKVFGVDLSVDYLKIAQANGVEVAKAELAELPFEDCSFDALTVCDVLEHLINLDKSVSELKRVLKVGGYLIVRVPNEEDLSSYVSDMTYKFSHVRTFSANSLQLYMEKCFDLSLIKTAYCARGFYTASQLIYPAVPQGSSLRGWVERRAKDIEYNQKGQKNETEAKKIKHAYKILERCMEVSLEEQVDALIALRDYPDSEFKYLASRLYRPAELLAVFQKCA